MIGQQPHQRPLPRQHHLARWHHARGFKRDLRGARTHHARQSPARNGHRPFLRTGGEQNAISRDFHRLTLAREGKRAGIGIEHPKRGAGAIGDIKRAKPRNQFKPRRHVVCQRGIGAGQFGSAKYLPAGRGVFIHHQHGKPAFPRRNRRRHAGRPGTDNG